jgi:hypothetical protein
MNDAVLITAERLRIAVDNDKGEPKARPTKPTFGPRPKQRFAQIPLHWLSEPYFRKRISPEVRLYLVLQYATKRGARVVRLTNYMAAEACITRQHKTQYLRKLERQGLIRIMHDGNRNPEISLTR